MLYSFGVFIKEGQIENVNHSDIHVHFMTLVANNFHKILRMHSFLFEFLIFTRDTIFNMIHILSTVIST